MNGKIVQVTDNHIIARLDDGSLVRHNRSEHLFKVGEDVETIADGHTLYMVATQGHVYLTPDYWSRDGETRYDENGTIMTPSGVAL
jgi:hypothetical protein